MIFVLWLFFTPFRSYGLFIPPSTTATGTAGAPELGSLLATQVEVGAQIVLDHGKLATCDYVGDEAGEWLKSRSVDVEVCPFLITKMFSL